VLEFKCYCYLQGNDCNLCRKEEQFSNTWKSTRRSVKICTPNQSARTEQIMKSSFPGISTSIFHWKWKCDKLDLDGSPTSSHPNWKTAVCVYLLGSFKQNGSSFLKELPLVMSLAPWEKTTVLPLETCPKNPVLWGSLQKKWHLYCYCW